MWESMSQTMSSFRFPNLQIASSFRRGNRGKMSADDLEGIIWSPTEYRLKFVLDNFPLPQVVEVVQGYLISDEDSIASGQILTLHGQRTMEKLVGYDNRNVEVNIPISCPYKVRIRTGNDEKIYPTVKDLCNCTPLPKCVELTEKPEFTNCGLRKGDMLIIERIETSFHGEPKGIVFLTIENSKTVTLPMHVLCHFKPCPLPCDISTQYLVRDLVEQRSFPFFIEFLQQECKDSPYSPDLGVIQINDICSTNIVLASSKVESVRFSMTFPTDLPLTIKVAQGMLDNSDAYSRVCQELHESIDIRRYENLILSDPYTTGDCFYGIYDELPPVTTGTPLLPHHHTQWTPPSTRRRSNPSRSSSSLDSEDSEERKNRKGKKNNLKFLLFKNKRINETVPSFARSVSVPAVKGTSISKNSKSVNSSPYLLPQHLHRPYRETHLSGESDDCSDAENFEEIAHCMDAQYYRRVSGATRDSSKSSTDSGVSLPTKGKMQNKQVPKDVHGIVLQDISGDQTEQEDSDGPIKMKPPLMTTHVSGDDNYFVAPDSEEGMLSRNGNKAGTLISSSSMDTTKSTSTNEDVFQQMDNEANDSYDDKVSSTNSGATDSLGHYDHTGSTILTRQLDDFDSITSPAQSIKSSKEEIMGETEEGVCLILDKLNLSSYQEIFKENQINGELLVELDVDDMIQSLGLNMFEAIKLLSYVDGWRPDDTIAISDKIISNRLSTDTDVFCSVESIKELESNSSSWTCNELCSRMNSINLSEVANFCKNNQVNGELLKACLNRQALVSIKDDYNITLTPLNEKKLANYVLKGWRPDLQIKTRQSSPTNSQ